MEEILASIKRVIREDGRVPAQGSSRAPKRARPEAGASAPAAQEEDVLELEDPMDGEDGLISDNAAAASRQSLAALSAMRSAPPAAAADSGGALDNVVRDMLRPMLKEWLDEHLPQIVEELVTREIVRITGRNL